MKDEILALARQKDFSRLRSMLLTINPADIAPIFEEIELKEMLLVFRLLPKETAAEVFVLMETDIQELIIKSFNDQELKEVIEELFFDDAADIIEEMPASVAKRILKAADSDARKQINMLLAYPEDSAGSIMTTEYIDLKKHMTVDEALDRIREIGFESETIYTCYVTSKSRKLQGIVSVKDLLLNPKDAVIGSLMDENIIFSSTLEDKEAVAEKFSKYDLMALPVVDKENRLVGIVTVDDAIDVLVEETTEDMDKMAAILPSDRSYFRTSVFSTFKSRIPWLMLLMLSATFTGAIISNFESKLTVFPALIAFIPMLMGTAGNCGSQSSVTVIRSISLGDIEFKDIFRVIWKELRVSVVCGVVLAAVNFLKLVVVDYWWLGTFDSGSQLLEIAAVCITLLVTVIVAKFVGCSLPIVAKRIGLDPAVMASPFITTVVDALSLIIYFGTATLLLSI